MPFSRFHIGVQTLGTSAFYFGIPAAMAGHCGAAASSRYRSGDPVRRGPASALGVTASCSSSIRLCVVPVGFLPVAGRTLAPQSLVSSGGTHDGTVGRIGTWPGVMTEEVWNTGRPSSAGWLTAGVCAFVIAAAALRIAAAFG